MLNHRPFVDRGRIDPAGMGLGAGLETGVVEKMGLLLASSRRAVAGLAAKGVGIAGLGAGCGDGLRLAVLCFATGRVDEAAVWLHSRRVDAP